MERTIYSKYSNERAERFRIRTDIVTDEAGEKKVYKYACTIQAGDHIRRQEELGKQLDAAYAGSRITFCPCTTEDVPGDAEACRRLCRGTICSISWNRRWKPADNINRANAATKSYSWTIQ